MMKTVILILAIIAVTQAALISRRKTNYMQWIEVEEFNRIVGGSVTKPNQFKHQISLQFNQGGWYHVCGGSIIGKLWVITAAHCVHNTKARKLRVDVGQHIIEDTDDNIIKIAKVYVHSGYNTRTLANDIALLKLKSSAILQPETTKAVAIRINKLPQTGQVTITGWGATSEGGSGSAALRKVKLDIVSDADCTDHYGSEFMVDEMFCAGYAPGGKDSCQGDSGGPVLFKGKLAGLVSWGYGCARSNTPGVYTRISHYNKWIKDTKQ